jgi:hypothetical protein
MGTARTAPAYEPIIYRDSNHRGDIHPWLTIPRYHSIYPSILISVRIAVVVIIAIAITIAILGNLSSKIFWKRTYTYSTWHLAPFFRLDLITCFLDRISTLPKKKSNNQPSTLFKNKNGNYGIYFYSSLL